jgi:molybdenum cofactor synthesis domain-containing protein
MGASVPAAIRRQPVAGVVIIGNEVLSLKVHDLNTPAVLHSLNEAGVRVGEVAIIEDADTRIAQVVADFSRRFDFVITTGGVGPTHDDCTWKAVAQAFCVPMVENPLVLDKMQRRLGRELTVEQRRMAWLPEGTELDESEGKWPLLRKANVYVLPGVPALVKSRLPQICLRWSSRRPELAITFWKSDEFDVVPAIDAVVAEFGDLEIGSYPIFDDPDHRLRLTFEGWDKSRVESAVAAATQHMGADQLVRVLWRPLPAGGPQ